MKISAALMRRLKAACAISVDRKCEGVSHGAMPSTIPVFTDYKVSRGEIVMVDISAAEPPCDNLPEQGSLDILFENEGLLAVNKPTGIIVHPSRSRNSSTLANFVAGYLRRGDARRVPSSCACHAVNRLDRDTSGVVLFAKNSYMKARASAALSDGSAIKEYLALVCGVMPKRGVIDAPIRRMEERNMLRVPSPDGQRAVTHYETLQVITAGEGRVSLVRLRLETGRTHQIRVHCLYIGRPILGDKLYCTPESLAMTESLCVAAQSLHAHKLGFEEPLSGQYIEISAPPPEYFAIVSQSKIEDEI